MQSLNKNITDMKRTAKFATFIVAVMLSLSASAQVDTAWMKFGYQDYYIHPQFLDPNCETFFCTDSLPIGSNPMFMVSLPYSTEWTTGVAQRFDLLEDTLRLAGVAFLANTAQWDLMKVGILDDSKNIIYEQEFIFGGFQDGNPYNGILTPRFIECFFDSVFTITQFDYYYICVQSLEYSCNRYEGGGRVPSSLLFVHKREGDVSCGYGTKYRPLAVTCMGSDMWRSADADLLRYNNLYFDYNVSCSDTIYSPAGFFPMRAVEDTTTMALVNVALAADAVTLYPNPTKSGEITVEAAENILNVEIYDIANRIVRTESANAKSVRLNLSALSSGTYLAKVRTESGTVARKFIIE